MKCCLSFLAFVALYWVADAGYARNPPKVQLYSHAPGDFSNSNDNVLICHVSEFHPPDITIQLLRNGEELPNSVQTDLAFRPNWHFHLTRSASFSPKQGDKYICRVDHGGRVTDYVWEPNM